MLKVVLIIAAALAVVVIVILIAAALRPDTLDVQRETVIHAPAEAIQPLVSDFRNWQRWSPYEKLDPDMSKTFSEPSSGPGASYAWDGNNKAGAGRMEITESSRERVRIALDFLRPMECKSAAEFTFLPENDSTRVIWSMSGKNQFAARVAGLFLNMDELIGKDFEEGLATLKAVSEAGQSASNMD